MGHRYWRLYITASTSVGDMLLSLQEIEMRATAGGEDQCSGGTASASHVSGDAFKLFDDNNSNYWVNGTPALGTVCWIRYDFGVGVAVSVNELWFMPRFSNQCPKDFNLQWSDDNVAWTDRASWSGMTSWQGGFSKTLTLPPEGLTKVVRQLGLPYGIALAVGLRADYELGIMRQKGAARSYAMLLERTIGQPFGAIVEAGASRAYNDILEAASVQPCALLLDLAHWREWRNLLERASRQPLHDTREASLSRVWSLATPVARGIGQSCEVTLPLHAGLRQAMDLLERNPVAARCVRRWDLHAAAGPLAAPWPLVTLNGLPVDLEEASLSQGPDDPHWSARLVLGRDADFIGLVPEGELELHWGGERHALLVAHKGVARGPDGPPRRVVTGIGVSARHAFPRALPVTRAWPDPVWARDAVEAVLGEAVSWELPDWRLPAGRLAVREAAPLEVAALIAGAVGGVARARPDGVLRLGRRFPVPVPLWESGEPDHLFTDATDILEMVEEGRCGAGFNRVIVEESLPDAPPAGVWLEPDPESGARTQRGFAPGETVPLLAMMTPGVTVTALDVSTGELLDARPVVRRVSEDLVFRGGNRALLARPACAIDSVIWLGNDLGPLTLERDARTVVAARAGAAIARVTHTLMTHALHPYRAPLTQNGSDHFAALVALRAEAGAAAGRSLTLWRGDGMRGGMRVVSPLLSDPVALRARGEAELDRGEALAVLRLTLWYRPGLAPGDRVEALDGLYGASRRGIVTGLRHELTRTGAITRLEVITRL
ncbi:MAG: hypothetical protein HQM03_11880 [Magnetococcales bacterium]|nr:hypothetical protein [Magnetococcales bacterium]